MTQISFTKFKNPKNPGIQSNYLTIPLTIFAMTNFQLSDGLILFQGLEHPGRKPTAVLFILSARF